MKITNFFKGLKRAVEFFDLNPYGFSVNEQKRSEQVEKLNALVGYLQVQSKRHEGLIDNLKKKQEQKVIGLMIDIVTLKDEIARLKNEDKETVITGSTFSKPTKKKGKKVVVRNHKLELLTQTEAKNVFEYKDGDLYWKRTLRSVKKRDVAGTIAIPSSGNKFKKIRYGGKSYRVAYIIFLIFHGYFPKRISFIDKNPLNTRIENLKEIALRNV